MRACLDCGADISMPTPRWQRTSREERERLLAAGHRRYGARGLCAACNKRGSYAPTRHRWNEVWEESEFFYGLGMTEVEIAQRLGIQVESLRRSRKRYLDRSVTPSDA